MSSAIAITGSGISVPDFTITNDELCEAFNQYARNFNEENAVAIESGELAQHSEGEEGEQVRHSTVDDIFTTQPSEGTKSLSDRQLRSEIPLVESVSVSNSKGVDVSCSFAEIYLVFRQLDPKPNTDSVVNARCARLYKCAGKNLATLLILSEGC